MSGGHVEIPAVWPFQGRNDELGRIELARSQGAVGVVIVAPMGVGKTRLAKRFIDDAAEHGAFARWVRATHSTAEIPLGAFAGLLSTSPQTVHDYASVMAGFAADLSGRAAGREVVLGVDDAHLLDSASAALLLQLAESSVVFVLATVEAGEPCPDAVTALWKDAGAARLDLAALGESELAELVEATLDAPIEKSAQRWLAQRSQGNVLYAQQLVIGAVESGALVHTEGIWRMIHSVPLSASLRELLAARMGALTASERDALELLALGEPLALEDFTELAGASTLVELETHNLAFVDAPARPDSEVRTAHPLIGELVLTKMPASSGRSHRLRLADALSARAEVTPQDALRKVVWLIDAGEAVPAGTLLEAARAAILAGGELGSRLAGLALADDGGLEASLVLASAHLVHGRFAEAEVVLAKVEGEIEDREQAFEYVQDRGAALYWGLDRGEDAIALFERAKQWWPDADWERDIEVLRLEIASLLAEPGRHSDALERASVDELLSADLRGRAKRALTADHFLSGRVLEAEAIAAAMQPQLPLRGELAFLEFGTGQLIGACRRR